MVIKRFLIVWAAFLVLGSSCQEKGPPQVYVKWPKLVVSTKAIGSGFMMILNDGKSSDFLIKCAIKEYPSVSCELHDLDGGRMKMIKSIEVEPGSEVLLKPGSKHLMFFGLPENPPDEVTIVLTFEKTGNIEVKAEVQSL